MLGKDNDREGSKLILGDPQLGDAICESVNYTSGQYVRFVFSFTDEDNVTPEEAREIVKEWFKEYMTGFSADEFHLDIVEHQDTKQLHYHARIPKKNLLTNTQLKPYYHQADLNYKIAVNEFIAEKYNLTLGTDHKRLILPPQEKEKRIAKWRKEHGQEPYNLSNKKGRAVAEEGIADLINDLNTQGLVNSLDDVKAELMAMGFTIPNEGYDKGKGFHYLTIAQGDNKLRLKGDIYGRGFYKHSREDRAKAIGYNRSFETGRGSDKRSRADVTRALQKERSKRLKWIDKQYGGARTRAVQRLNEEQQRTKTEFDQEPKLTIKSSSPHRTTDRRNHRNIGNSLLHPRPHQHKQVSDEKGIDDDRVTRRAIKRAREAREQSERRTESIRAESKKTIRRNGEAIQRELDRYKQRQRELNSVLKNAHGSKQPNYQAIGNAAQERGHGREVKTHLSGVFRYFAKKLNSFKQRIDRANRELTQQIIESIKGRLMQELNNFKTNINLAEFSTAFGYYKDKNKSSLNAPVMRHENGDKIIIGKDKADGHYVYSNPNNNSDNGTIIDFVKHRTNETLGHIRRRLRAWMHNPQPVQNIKITASNKDTQKIVYIWERLKNDEMILTKFRGIEYNTMQWISQSGRVCYDKQEKALYFPMYDINGLCGIEKRTESDKRIIAGSSKGLHTVGDLTEAQRIVIFESPIDMLSYKSLGKGEYGDFYISTMGSIGESGKNSLKAIFERNKTAKIVLAVDSDEGGQKIIDKIVTISNRDMYRQEPKGKDWNEDLQKQQTQSQKRAGMTL